MNLRFSFFLCIAVCLACTRDQPCSNATPIVKFVSFPDFETDSIVLRKYVKNSNFASLLDSTIISRSNSIYEKSTDTLHILTQNGGDYSLDIKFEYEVYMPLANKLFKISNIVQQQTEISVGISLDKRGCVNPVKSYTLNGQTISGASNYPFIYLNK